MALPAVSARPSLTLLCRPTFGGEREFRVHQPVADDLALSHAAPLATPERHRRRAWNDRESPIVGPWSFVGRARRGCRKGLAGCPWSRIGETRPGWLNVHPPATGSAARVASLQTRASDDSRSVASVHKPYIATRLPMAAQTFPCRAGPPWLLKASTMNRRESPHCPDPGELADGLVFGRQLHTSTHGAGRGSLTHQIQTWVSSTINDRRSSARRRVRVDPLRFRSGRCRADSGGPSLRAPPASRPVAPVWSPLAARQMRQPRRVRRGNGL